MSLTAGDEQTLSAFRSNVEDLALAEVNRLDARRIELTTELDAVLYQLKAVRAVLRASQNGNGGRPKGSKNRKSQAAAKFTLSPDRAAEIMPWLTGNNEEITSTTLRAKFPSWSGSYCNMVLKHLREENVVRLSGTSGQSNVYRSMV